MSLDDSVVAVDGDGHITGVAPGTATTAVLCADGKVTGSIKAKVAITPSSVDAS